MCSDLEDVDELVAEAVLEGRPLAVDPARHQEHLLVLDVDALDRPDALGEVEDLRLAERRGGEPATPSSQITGGLRHSSIVVHIENDGAKISLPSSSVTTRLAPSRVPSSSISREQVVGGVPREHVGEPGLDADPDQREPPRALPLLGHGELLVAELDAASSYGARGCGFDRRHRHVEVVGAGGERTVEDRHVEDRVDGVHHVGDPVLRHSAVTESADGGVDLRRDEAVVAERLDRLRRAGPVVVGDHAELEEVATRRDRGEGGSDAAGADQQDSHDRHLCVE